MIRFPTPEMVYEQEEENEGLLRPILYIPKKIHDQIDAYVQSTDLEVSGVGRVNPDGLVVDGIYLPKQEGTGTTTDIDKGDLAVYITKLGTGAGLNLWWHSHVEMSVFESATDKATIQETLRGWGGDFNISLVTNKRKEFHCTLYLWKPIVLETPMDVEIIEEPDDNYKVWQKEAHKKVKEPAPVYTPAPGYRYGWKGSKFEQVGNTLKLVKEELEKEERGGPEAHGPNGSPIYSYSPGKKWRYVADLGGFVHKNSPEYKAFTGDE